MGLFRPQIIQQSIIVVSRRECFTNQTWRHFITHQFKIMSLREVQLQILKIHMEVEADPGWRLRWWGSGSQWGGCAHLVQEQGSLRDEQHTRMRKGASLWMGPDIQAFWFDEWDKTKCWSSWINQRHDFSFFNAAFGGSTVTASKLFQF